MTIRILPDSIINRIAAGEVIERPANAVKELIENALDAGSTEVRIDIQDAGRTLIQVSDDGCGMDRENLLRSVMRHATSKLASDDLLDINSMGFRGEALPSIASVSDMFIDTRRAADPHGLRLDAQTGVVTPSSWESGTRVRVENLFAKTPARLKFLRADRFEMLSIVEAVKRLAMARPAVGFDLCDGKWKFPKGQSILERAMAVMGADSAGRMIEINCRGGNLKLTGYISEPTLRRVSSADQYLFVNNRPVKDKVLVSALRAAYMDVMSAREFPLCALYLELPTNHIDVNVSPAKTDVHFLEPAYVRGFIIKTLRDALGVTLAARSDAVPHVWSAGVQSQSFIDWSESKTNDLFDFATVPTQDFPLGRALCQFGNKYILSETKDSVIITDQHAAHERIIYEKMRRGEVKKQPLMIPVIIEMRREEAIAVMSAADDLANAGLVISDFGGGSISISERPADWDMDWAALLKDIASEVMDQQNSNTLSHRLHLKLANRACHNSVRAGQKLDLTQMDALLRDVENTERGGQCNHGRPVYKIFPISEIDGWFERV